MNKQFTRNDFIFFNNFFSEKNINTTITDINFEDKNKNNLTLKINLLHNHFNTIAKKYNITLEHYQEYEILYEFILTCPSTLTTHIINHKLSEISSHHIEKNFLFSKLAASFLIETLLFESKNFLGITSEYVSYQELFIQSINKGVQEKILDDNMLEYNLELLAHTIIPERDLLFDYMGIFTLQKRFLLKSRNSDKIYEAPQVFWMRVAMGLAFKEENKNEKAIEYYHMLSQLLYAPSTPTLCHSGFVIPQLTSCYLSSVEDDLKEIFQSYSDTAQLAKWSGGIATAWTKIRACGAYIKKINLESQGLIPYLKIEDDIIASISKTGTRRGGKAVYIEPWHYDIEDFLDLKKNTGDHRKRTHDLNTALWIPDLFMKRISEGSNWTLFSPDETPELANTYGKKFDDFYLHYEKMALEGKIKLCKTYQASDLWKKILTRIFETGHPWITFKDACNIRSPQKHVGMIYSSNLCTEITLNSSQNEIAVCNLGSINLPKHIDSDGNIDFNALQKTISTAVEMLDNVIDLTYYPVPQTENSNMRHRPIGLGVMGWQDVLFAKKYSIESKEAAEIINTVSEFIAYHAIKKSIELAIKKGAYKSFKGSLWDQGILPQDTLPLLAQERNLNLSLTTPIETMNWQEIRNLIKKHGIRNSNIFAIAPTATISTITGCFPSIEPIYKNIYVKSNLSGEFSIVNKYLQKDLHELHLWNEHIIEKIKFYDGSIQSIDEIPDYIKERYKTAFEVDQKKLLYLTGIRGRWIDQSQSHNIFFESTSGKALSDIYFYAWELGLKTTYYLKTLGKSQIEKSTLGSEFGLTQVRSTRKMCNLNDEGCESCQ
jgi:ribonucleoside-diphosphate reductase alpha chain